MMRWLLGPLLLLGPTLALAGTPASEAVAWRRYGPISIHWESWRELGGSYVANALNADYKPFVLAVNCASLKLNNTDKDGRWKAWESPVADFEKSFVRDLCRQQS